MGPISARARGVPPKKIHTDSVFASTEQPHDEASEERALLFDEPRSATVQVTAGVWSSWMDAWMDTVDGCVGLEGLLHGESSTS